MIKHNILFIGLDTHKTFTEVAYIEDQRGAKSTHLRLCRRYNRLMHKGKHRNVVVTAIAREMIAYIWAISREVVRPKIDVKLRISRVSA
jgi:hypothetical protein